MTELLRDHDGVAVYMDDILVYADTLEEHEGRLQKTALKPKRKIAGLKQNHEKCLLRHR